MKRAIHLFFLLAIAVLTQLFGFPQALAIYPPCQAITATVPTVDSVSYAVIDPVSGQAVSETWTVTQGAAGQRFIAAMQFHQGILGWIARYRNIGETYYTYEVHCRIYDPGRGLWKAWSWGPFGGFNTSVENFAVKDGVVGWTAHRSLGADAAAWREHEVLNATYDPQQGSWPLEQHLWQVPPTSAYGPKALLCKNGMAVWSMQGADASVAYKNGFFATIYDQELHLWKCSDLPINTETLEIPDETTQVRFTYYFLDVLFSRYHSYNPTTHQWTTSTVSTPMRRAFFAAYPESGPAPLRVWFWDCSTSFPPSGYEWKWLLAPNVLATERSPGYLYSVAGQYAITENVTNFLSLYAATGHLEAQAPIFNGSISINNGAAYTAAAKVSLSLGYNSEVREMCFRQIPGWIFWSPWQPVTSSLPWTLSTLHVAGETPDGPHYVSVKFRDQYTNESPEYQASIILVTTPPAIFLALNNGEAKTTNSRVRASWSANSNYPLEMSYTYAEAGATHPWSRWAAYQPTTKTILFSARPGIKTVILRIKDPAGNISQMQTNIFLTTPAVPFIYLLLEN